MCIDPATAVTVAGTAVKIGSEIFGADAQNDAAKANARSAREALRIGEQSLDLRTKQEVAAGSQEVQDVATQAGQAQSDVRASAAAGGVGGMTVDLLLQQIDAEKGLATQRSEDQTAANLAQIESERLGLRAGAQSRINAMPQANPFATGLRIGGHVTDFFDARISNKPKGT